MARYRHNIGKNGSVKKWTLLKLKKRTMHRKGKQLKNKRTLFNIYLEMTCKKLGVPK